MGNKKTLPTLRTTNYEFLHKTEVTLVIEARHNAFDSYKARLYEYQRKKSLNASNSELHHPTVWAEMKRQYTLQPGLKTLFQDIPEALT